MSSVYPINKGINREMEFKGLQAQYIWYLGAGVMVLLIAFIVMYVLHVNALLSVGVVLGSGAWLVRKVYWLSRTYGVHGLMKKRAAKQIPSVIKVSSCKVFLKH
jgi:hypothetical protein